MKMSCLSLDIATPILPTSWICRQEQPSLLFLTFIPFPSYQVKWHSDIRHLTKNMNKIHFPHTYYPYPLAAHWILIYNYGIALSSLSVWFLTCIEIIICKGFNDLFLEKYWEQYSVLKYLPSLCTFTVVPLSSVSSQYSSLSFCGSSCFLPSFACAHRSLSLLLFYSQSMPFLIFSHIFTTMHHP